MIVQDLHHDVKRIKTEYKSTHDGETLYLELHELRPKFDKVSGFGKQLPEYKEAATLFNNLVPFIVGYGEPPRSVTETL